MKLNFILHFPRRMKTSTIVAGLIVTLFVCISFSGPVEANICYLVKCHIYFVDCMKSCNTIKSCNDCITWKWGCLAKNCGQNVRRRRRRNPNKNLQTLLNAFKSKSA